ncbi:hypothetical protein TSUD_305870 [Trifolium subterraneum]|uniref:Uncharacterized protein n=1 Tax=Trifolium subterraneum TaxID=3900 RepID=A0A2Z6MVX2_TRISU|nr:hypothetical protein TSUD_305870 [Trifolium subterraneum]
MQRRSPPKHRHDGTSPLPLGMDWSPAPRKWCIDCEHNCKDLGHIVPEEVDDSTCLICFQFFES